MQVVTIATMARIIGELKPEIKVPLGVCVASDAEMSFDLAAAVEADFVREVLHGAAAGVYGISNVHPERVERHRAALGLMGCKTMTAVIPEGTRQLTERPHKEEPGHHARLQHQSRLRNRH